MSLAKWDKNNGLLPEGFYDNDNCYLWIHRNGKIYKRKRAGKIHAQLFGDDAWGNEERGYYNEGFGLLYGYHMPLSLRRKLEKKFKNAMYYIGRDA